MVRAWRDSGDPEKVMGLNRPKRMTPRTDSRVLDLIDEVIAADARSTAGDIIAEVVRVARDRKIALPDPSTVSKYVRRKRPQLLTERQRAGFDLIVDHTVIDIAVDFGDGVARRPLATMAIDIEAEAVVGLALSSGTPDPKATAAALLDALRHRPRLAQFRTGRPRLGIVAMSESEGGTAVETLRKGDFDVSYLKVHAYGGGMLIEALLGREHAALRLKQRLVWNTGDRRLASPRPGAGALTLLDADELVRGRLFDGRSISVFEQLGDAARSSLCATPDGFAQLA